jgi:hypothetical protein
MKAMRGGALWGLALVLGGVTACGEAVAPGDEPGAQELSEAEVEFLASELDQDLGGVLGAEEDAEEAAAAVVEGGEGAALLAPVTREFSFERSVTCRNGGSITVSGSGDVTVDREAHSIETNVAGEKTIVDCARQRGDVVFTMNGNATWSAHRLKVEGVLVELVHDHEGSFTVTTSDGREKSCSFDLHAELVEEGIHITGEFCGREVDVIRDLPSRD